ncbi:hypothetical protein [Corynebacterium sphenisci]|uniref:hypothetical protein n=1 Tax=Corynebacterium sphenisci TaxID=191493 RepID=UPI00095313FF|nr:hypothetical protein [Corynebacterium sphenisci]
MTRIRPRRRALAAAAAALLALAGCSGAGDPDDSAEAPAAQDPTAAPATPAAPTPPATDAAGAAELLAAAADGGAVRAGRVVPPPNWGELTLSDVGNARVTAPADGEVDPLAGLADRFPVGAPGCESTLYLITFVADSGEVAAGYGADPAPAAQAEGWMLADACHRPKLIGVTADTPVAVVVDRYDPPAEAPAQRPAG